MIDKRETIHIHTDIENLKYFVDKNGLRTCSDRLVAYAMQNEHIVGVFYTLKQANAFYEKNKFNDNLPIIYYWDEKLSK